MSVPEALPATGVAAEQILAEIAMLRGADLPTRGGRVFAYVYDPAVPGLDELAAAAHAAASDVNGLDPTAFPSLLAMENGLVGAAAALLGGGADGRDTVVGTVTGGGTESLLLAVKAARDARPGLAGPRMVVPVTAHAAFAKAAEYLRVRLDTVPVDRHTVRPSPDDVAAAICDETVLVACSAPAYPYGVIDPVADIAAVAAAAGVRCHVDACFGGWLLPYLRRAGHPVPPFGFEVGGVTSVSVDLHKYAYAPKGVSVLLHADAALRRPQYFAYADWPGYPMLNATVASTRSGGPIAAAWATLRHLGHDGYRRLAERTWRATTDIAAAVSDVDGLRLLAEPQGSVVACTTDDPDPYVLADELAARGWHVQTQLPFADLPASLHLTVTPAVADKVVGFADALRASVAAARAAGPARVPPALAEALRRRDPHELTADQVAELADAAGLRVDGAAPPMATVNALLASVSPQVRAGLLVEFVSLLQRPAR